MSDQSDNRTPVARQTGRRGAEASGGELPASRTGRQREVLERPPEEAGRPRSVEQRDARALRALAHPTRMRLLGLLRTQGAMTATQAAHELGETPQRCTFHLGQLSKYGLVEEAGGGRGRERPWRATAASTSWPNVLAAPEASAAAQLLEAVAAEQHFEAVLAWIEGKQTEPAEWQEAAQLNDFALHLTADELAELGRRVGDLLEPFAVRNERPDLRPEGARLVTFLNLAFPRLRRQTAGD
jgi:DNA-binding transcriptional ArsR family regulator